MDGEDKTTWAEISEEDFLTEIGRESAARAPGFAKFVAAAWGTDRWCILKRNQMPQKPVLDAMRTDGAWDLDASAIGPSADPGATAAQRRRVHESFFHGKTPTTSA